MGLFASVAGCGGPSDAPETVPVTGLVTYKGKPVPELMITFNPEGPGMIATGTTDAEGKFSLMTSQPGDGAKVGTYLVAIVYVPESELGPPMPGFPSAPKNPASVIPKKYANIKSSRRDCTRSAGPAVLLRLQPSHFHAYTATARFFAALAVRYLSSSLATITP
jgi:hypothetical protein